VSPAVCRALPLLGVSQCGWDNGDIGPWYYFILRIILYGMKIAEIIFLSNGTILILAYNSVRILASKFAIFFKNFLVIMNPTNHNPIIPVTNSPYVLN